MDVEVAGGQAREHAAHRALECVAGRARTDGFADGKREEFSYAQRCGQSERGRAGGGDGMEIEWDSDANHGCRFCQISRSRLPSRSTDTAMSGFDNFSADALVDAAERVIASFDDAFLEQVFRDADSMDGACRTALIDSIFDAFRERGESSDDAAEGAGTTVDAIMSHDAAALRNLFAYAGASAGLLKEATAIFVEEHPDLVGGLPKPIVDAVSRQLSGTR